MSRRVVVTLCVLLAVVLGLSFCVRSGSKRPARDSRGQTVRMVLGKVRPGAGDGFAAVGFRIHAPAGEEVGIAGNAAVSKGSTIGTAVVAIDGQHPLGEPALGSLGGRDVEYLRSNGEFWLPPLGRGEYRICLAARIGSRSRSICSLVRMR